MASLTTFSGFSGENVTAGDRDKLFREILLNTYAQEVAYMTHKLVDENYEDRAIDYSSQRQHDCLTMTNNERVWLW